MFVASWTVVRYTSDVKGTYIYPSCGKENLLVKCVFSIRNSTLFHVVSLACHVYQCPRWLCVQTFNAKARILLSLENMFKSYIQKDKQVLKWWSKAIQKPFIPMLSKGLQKPFIPMLSKGLQKPFIPMLSKGLQKVYKSLIYRCFQKIFKSCATFLKGNQQKPFERSQKHFQKVPQVGHPCMLDQLASQKGYSTT